MKSFCSRIAVAALALLPVSNVLAQSSQDRRKICGAVQSANDDRSELRLYEKARSCGPAHDCSQLGAQIPVKIVRPALRSQVEKLTKGDGICVEVFVTSNGSRKEFELNDLMYRPAIDSTPGQRIAAMGAGAAGLLFLALLFSWGSPRKLLLIGKDNRYSNSKAQFTIWFGCMAIAYLSLLYLRWVHSCVIGHISIPQNLLLLSGLSSLTFAGAKAITANKLKANANAKPKATKANFPEDLAQDDNKDFDLGDFQMILITLIAAVTFLVQVYGFLGDLDMRVSVSLPDVDTTILAVFGLGQGAYLTKKAAGGNTN